MEEERLVQLVMEGVLPEVDGKIFLRESGGRRFTGFQGSSGCCFPYLVDEGLPMAKTTFRVYKQVARASVKEIFDSLYELGGPYWREGQVGSFLAGMPENLFSLASYPTLFFLYSEERDVRVCMGMLVSSPRKVKFDTFSFLPKPGM